ncbi:hypothetical protein Kpol_2001p34 [Vanderwaltozyma polyspora DSM 70294]|uniref:Zinc/iron permease n=1 Tax=Vanderwaltozyma polyspora (strain ATCC 22028 / DSM 70294 / BCRC 21397 / CBS 2163 / NBRC 10782 / NRRL Y-8283 / UCD 57-17) TaxID=436907 RepID=A7TGR6_VANPO|nr:uncharacterized protein Kpol_2001p34 [Vanderwaltozyma polyspora DSM 70294]EDO18529.1 hypothetical protein Kpol_2001p34 [Vanderwaltozyma polyspora DSM 70294]
MMDIPRWLSFSLINSGLCILGGLCVPLLSMTLRTKQNTNTKLVNYGLSLSAGSMITTALYKMLPHMDDKNSVEVFVGLLFGILTSLSINYIVHAFASESLLHCAHSHDTEHHDDHSDHEHTEVSYTGNDNDQSSDSLVNDEVRPLLSKRNTQKSTLIDLITNTESSNMGSCDLGSCVPMAKSKSFSCVPEPVQSSAITRSGSCCSRPTTENATTNSTIGKGHGHGVSCLENDVGYDLENLSIYREHFLSGRKSNADLEQHPHIHNDTIHNSASYHSDHQFNDHVSRDHHHHLETPFSKLLSIGLQTVLVLTLHKFPEGFIIYYTNRGDKSSSLGLSIFISLAIHNFVEGFAMTLPFYAALQSKTIPILITTVLGGGSQPLGALIGYWIFRNKDKDSNDPESDLRMQFFLSLTAGFLLVIGLQMFQTGIGFSDGHHHHDGEQDEEVKENHSLGTTCLKWCCIGVVLILASGLFV